MKPRLRFGAKVMDIFIWAVIFIVLYGEDDGNSVYLRSLLTPMPLKPAGEGGHIHKGVYWTLWFWLFENFATSNCSSKTKQRWMPLGCIIYYLDRFDAKERRWSVKGRLYIHIGVGLSTLLVSTNRAMRRPSNSGTGDRTGSTFCVYRGI